MKDYINFVKLINEYPVDRQLGGYHLFNYWLNIDKQPLPLDKIKGYELLFRIKKNKAYPKWFNIRKIKNRYGVNGNVKLTNDQYKAAQEKFGTMLPRMINKLDDYLERSNRQYDSHYSAMVRWVYNACLKEENFNIPVN